VHSRGTLCDKQTVEHLPSSGACWNRMQKVSLGFGTRLPRPVPHTLPHCLEGTLWICIVCILMPTLHTCIWSESQRGRRGSVPM
jgi:hypothetical protein